MIRRQPVLDATRLGDPRGRLLAAGAGLAAEQPGSGDALCTGAAAPAENQGFRVGHGATLAEA